jgi:hypothetical protein
LGNWERPFRRESLVTLVAKLKTVGRNGDREAWGLDQAGMSKGSDSARDCKAKVYFSL